MSAENFMQSAKPYITFMLQMICTLHAISVVFYQMDFAKEILVIFLNLQSANHNNSR